MDSISLNKPKAPFRFLDLPPELRDLVYADILTTSYQMKWPLPWYLHPASRLTILRISKLVHQEAKEILYRSGTFRFYVPFRLAPIYRFPKSKPVTDLMRNITLDLERLDEGRRDFPAALESTIAFLRRFSDPAIPRVRCTVVVWRIVDRFLSEVSFLEAFGKLTAFKTVTLIHGGGTSKTVDEYLSAMLGPADHSLMVHPKIAGQSHHLTYHPSRYAYGMKGKEATGSGALSTMI